MKYRNKYKYAKIVYNNLSDEEKLLVSPRGHFVDSDKILYRYIEFDNKKPVGFIDVYKYNGTSNTTGFIVLAVIPSHRGSHIGAYLIYKAIDSCKRLGLKKLIYRVDNSNTHSILIAERTGFNKVYQTKQQSVYEKIL